MRKLRNRADNEAMSQSVKFNCGAKLSCGRSTTLAILGPAVYDGPEFVDSVMRAASLSLNDGNVSIAHVNRALLGATRPTRPTKLI